MDEIMEEKWDRAIEKDIKERMEVSIKETKEDEIKDLVFTLNTGQSGKADYTTELINGDLCGIIISTDNPIKVKITLVNYPDIILFEMINLHGSNYIPIRADAVSSEGEHIRDSVSYWYLNDRLVCEIEGLFNTNTKFIIRYK